ncbi:class I SAM-dependent methyltransferase [Methylobacterium sp. ID0610]|uniref:class I SAM-dependent methyltransferase n=1 Tax=Methylobacterium carpenticola TaxID=3344827 RepID=UPI0036AF39DC
MSGTPLLAELRTLIAQTGPIPVEHYMALCLGHPRHGYYRTRDPLGAAGDFTTAPEISQIFGELLGLWAAGIWHEMGRPAPCRLVELGPGRGTLMADALRAIRAALPPFAAAIDLHLVETSPVLRAAQNDRLAPAALPVHWHDAVETVPAGPAIILANEFFDALPVRQYERTARGWCTRRVGLAPEGDGLAFGLDPEPVPDLAAAAPEGAVLTIPSAGLAVMRGIAGRLAREGGALLAIDYGEADLGLTDTLQAVSRHRSIGVLDAPGETDLTAQVDFGALARAAHAAGAAIHGPVPQRDFLLALGLQQRADRLAAGAPADRAAAVVAGAARLVDEAPTGMGRLFKVLGVSGPGLPNLPALPRSTLSG